MPLMQLHQTFPTQRKLFRLSTEKRAHPRISLVLGGRIMLQDRREYASTSVDASLQAMTLRTDARPRLGERIIGYFDTIGRIEGHVERIAGDHVVITLSTTLRKRDRLASQMTWLANRDILNLPEDRRNDRIVPNDPRIEVRRLGDFETPPVMGHLIDISTTGAGVSVNGRFLKDDQLMLGSTPAKVMRVFEGGVAVEFRVPIPDHLFSVHMVL